MLILVYLSVGRKDIMKIGYTVFYIFESARVQDKALYRRSPYRLFQERSPYHLFSKGRNSERPYHLGCQAPLGRGSEAAREKRPSAFVANRACHPGLPLELENLMTEMRMFWIIDRDNSKKSNKD